MLSIMPIIMLIWIPLCFVFGFLAIIFNFSFAIPTLFEGIGESFSEITFAQRLSGVGKFLFGLSAVILSSFIGITAFIYCVFIPFEYSNVLLDTVYFTKNVYFTVFLDVVCWFVLIITGFTVIFKPITLIFKREFMNKILPATPVYLIVFAIFVIIKLYFMTKIATIGLVLAAFVYILIYLTLEESLS